MKNKRTTFETAIEIYNKLTGSAPTEIIITNLWHVYAGEWKKWNGFEEWMVYQGY